MSDAHHDPGIHLLLLEAVPAPDPAPYESWDEVSRRAAWVPIVEPGEPGSEDVMIRDPQLNNGHVRLPEVSARVRRPVRRRRTLLALIGTGVAIAAFFVTPAFGLVKEVVPFLGATPIQVKPPPPAGTFSHLKRRDAYGFVAPSPGSPRLSKAERVSAIAIIEADPLIQRLVAGKNPGIVRFSWMQGGGIVRIELEHPLDTSEPLPGYRVVDDDPRVAGDGHRLKLTMHAEWRHITSMDVVVDFAERAVIAIRPDTSTPGATVTELPGNVHFPPSCPGGCD